MRVFEGSGCAAANFVPDAPSPKAAMPPARKFRRILFGGSAVGVQQVQKRKRLGHAGFCNIAGVCKSLAFIPALTFVLYRASEAYPHARIRQAYPGDALRAQLLCQQSR